MAAERSAEEWKNKYYELADETDAIEKQFADSDKNYRKAISRLSILLEGDPALEALQKTLRKQLKQTDNENELFDTIEKVADVAVKLDDNSAASVVEQENHTAFLMLMNSLPGFIDQNDSIANFRDELNVAAEQGQLQTVITSISEKISNSYLTDNHQAVNPNRVLIRLLEHTVLPAEINNKVNNLLMTMYARLSSTQVNKEWDNSHEETVSLLNKVPKLTNKDRKESHTYLKKLISQIKNLNTAVDSESASRSKTFQISQEFDDLIHNQVNDIQTTVQGADDLDGLKNELNDSIGNMLKQVAQHKQTNQKSEHSSEKRMLDMKKRMVNMESETKQLRKTIEEKHKQAFFDPLTNVPNRLAYNDRSKLEYAIWRREGAPLSMAVIDVDFFKKVNDTYGHKAGDIVLKTIATLIKSVENVDFIARFGGEEFVMLLPDKPLAEALILAETVRQKISECSFQHKNQSVSITASIGVHEFQQGDDTDSAFEKADQALYKAKSNGRNCCVSSAE